MVYEKSLEAKFPALAKEWHPTRNGDKTPAKVFSQSNNRYWWRCSKCGHEWEAVLRNRTRLKAGCPVCAGQQVHVGINDLATVNKDLAAEWHPTKNGDLTPQMVTAGSGKKVWWLCPVCGYEWRSEISHRNTKTGCPVCAGRIVLPGFNDFASVHPDLVVIWHPTKNGTLTPEMVTAGSERKVWWKCLECGRSWRAKICHVSTRLACPDCVRALWGQTSFPEQAFFFYLKQVCIAQNRYLDKNVEFDIWLPENRIAIEYDGGRWHQDIEQDLIKNRYCEANNIRLIRIREPECPPISVECIVLKDLNESSLESAIVELVDLLGFTIDVSMNRDRIAIFEQYISEKKERSLAALNPSLAAEWHPTKNGTLTPEMVTYMSSKKVWWLCSKCGHEWQAVIASRSCGTGCRPCSRKNRGPYKVKSKIPADNMNENDHSIV